MARTKRPTAPVTWGPESRPRRRATRKPQQRLADYLSVAAGLGLAAVLALTFTVENRAAIHSPGGWWLLVARLSAMIGSYGLLIMVLLIARIPPLERAVGQDQLVRWHRKIAPYVYYLIVTHIVTVIEGYAILGHNGIVSQYFTFLWHYPDILSSVVGFILLTMAAATSIRQARHAMKYETWWSVHLYTYLGLALAFSHQIRTGIMFVGHPFYIQLWTGTWLAVGIVVFLVRFGLPLWRNLQWQLRIESVNQVAPGVYAVTVKGRRLERMSVSGGQFFQWRFLSPGLMWHSHPYSISALPRPPFMRLTVKGSGDQSSAIAKLRPGTRVFVEGPFGAFTHHKATTQKSVFIGAGVGLTPLRSLLEDMPPNKDVDVIIRATTVSDVVHRDELLAYASAHEGHYHELIGSRQEVRMNGDTFLSLVPDIRSADIYLCGPEGFMQEVRTILAGLRVPHTSIHYESFSF